MTGTLEQLVRETIEVTGATLPALMEKDAPILDRSAISPSDNDGFYLVGLIGGKEVGKSALVNALAGQPVTISTSYGPGTEMAIAYAHASQEVAVAALLERIVPGRFRVVTHNIADLRGLVLLDLPDIDSHYQNHLETTRAVLRHLLFPVWVGSVEKYADQQPMKLLAQVAAGNAPENFVFCLNKVDQVEGEGTQGQRDTGTKAEDGGVLVSSQLSTPPLSSSALAELREDYASRIGRALQMESPPRVFVVSAIAPQKFDLPELRQLLMRAKGQAAVKESKELAQRRQEKSLLGWLGMQQLPVRAARLSRLREEAEELLGSRVGPVLLEQVAPRLADDAAARLAIADEVLEERVARWPIVNLVHTFFSPLLVMARGMTSRQAVSPGDAQSVVDACLRQANEPISTLLQSAFGQLRRSQPIVGELYKANFLWEAGPADMAAGELSRRLAQTLLRQREAVRERLSGRAAWLGAPLRWLLTIGALLWFPFIQPILSTALAQNLSITKLATAALLIQVLGVDYLLKSVVFLFIWFLVLWLALRWNTQRKVARMVKKLAATDLAEPGVNLTTQSMQWMDDLLAPIREAEQRVLSLAQRIEEFDATSRIAG